MTATLARRGRPGRVQISLMLVAALALVLHGLMAPRAGLAGAHPVESGGMHADCPGHPPAADQAAAHDHHGRAVDKHDVPTPGQGSSDPLTCCTPLTAAVVPHALWKAGANQLLAERLVPAAFPPLTGLPPEGPRKPPRTSDQV